MGRADGVTDIFDEFDAIKVFESSDEAIIIEVIIIEVIIVELIVIEVVIIIEVIIMEDVIIIAIIIEVIIAIIIEVIIAIIIEVIIVIIMVKVEFEHGDLKHAATNEARLLVKNLSIDPEGKLFDRTESHNFLDPKVNSKGHVALDDLLNSTKRASFEAETEVGGHSTTPRLDKDIAKNGESYINPKSLGGNEIAHSAKFDGKV